MNHNTARFSLWSFLNSAFGIFLCSSVAIGGLSFLHTAWVKATERRLSAERLDLEIGLRIKDLNQLAIGANRGRYSNLVNLDRVLKGDTTRFYLRKPLFHDFEHRTLTDLLWRLQLLVPHRDRPVISDAIRTSIALDESVSAARYHAANTPSSTPASITDEDRLADQEDQLTKEFGQTRTY